MIDGGGAPLLPTIGGIVLLFAVFSQLPRPTHQPVETSARIGCALPSEHETMLVYINAKPDGSIGIECGPMVGGRGAYPGARK